MAWAAVETTFQAMTTVQQGVHFQRHPMTKAAFTNIDSTMRLVLLIVISAVLTRFHGCLVWVVPTSPSLNTTSKSSLPDAAAFLNTSCANSMQDLTQPCWHELNMSVYAEKWWQEHE